MDSCRKKLRGAGWSSASPRQSDTLEPARIAWCQRGVGEGRLTHHFIRVFLPFYPFRRPLRKSPVRHHNSSSLSRGGRLSIDSNNLKPNSTTAKRTSSKVAHSDSALVVHHVLHTSEGKSYILPCHYLCSHSPRSHFNRLLLVTALG